MGAAIDSVSAGHTYAITDSGELYVFRTSNLLSSPDPTECRFEAKFKTVDTAANLVAVKGGLLIDLGQQQ